MQPKSSWDYLHVCVINYLCFFSRISWCEVLCLLGIRVCRWIPGSGARSQRVLRIWWGACWCWTPLRGSLCTRLSTTPGSRCVSQIQLLGWLNLFGHGAFRNHLQCLFAFQHNWNNDEKDRLFTLLARNHLTTEQNFEHVFFVLVNECVARLRDVQKFSSSVLTPSRLKCSDWGPVQWRFCWLSCRCAVGS